jgi:UDP-glucose 4-epimerase
MVIPTFVRQALAGRPITVHGDGTQSRCFAYVGDVVEALIRLMDHPAAVGEVFNVGSNEEVAIGTLAQRVKALANSPSEIVTVPYHEAYGEGFEDMPRRVPEVSKVQALVGFRATVGLDEIIRRVIAYQAGLPSTGSGKHPLAEPKPLAAVAKG